MDMTEFFDLDKMYMGDAAEQRLASDKRNVQSSAVTVGGGGLVQIREGSAKLPLFEKPS